MNHIERKWSTGMWIMLVLAIFSFGVLINGIIGCQVHSNPIVIPPDGGGGTGGMFSTGGQSSTGGTSSFGGQSTTGGMFSTGGQATTSTASTDICDVAGQRLAVLNCPEAKTPKGTSYGDFCRHARSTHLDIHPECVAKITSCSQVASAYRGCP